MDSDGHTQHEFQHKRVILLDPAPSFFTFRVDHDKCIFDINSHSGISQSKKNEWCNGFNNCNMSVASVTHIFNNGQQNHDGVRKIFELIT